MYYRNGTHSSTKYKLYLSVKDERQQPWWDEHSSPVEAVSVEKNEKSHIKKSKDRRRAETKNDVKKRRCKKF